MSAQILIVALLVGGCAVHAAWLLMPAALRRALAARWLHRALVPTAGCSSGCDGCGSARKAAPIGGAAKPLVFHPRRPR